MKDVFFSSPEYKSYHFQRSINQIRAFLLIFILMITLSTFYDFATESEFFASINMIRFVMIVPYFVIVYILTYFEFSEKYYQPMILVGYVIVGLGISLILMMEPNAFHFYAIMGTCIVFFVLLIRMLFIYALTGTIVVLTVYHLFAINILYSVNETAHMISFFYLMMSTLILTAHYANEKRVYDDYKVENKLEMSASSLESELSKALTEVSTTQRLTVESLSSLAESKDKTTSDHLERVGYLCRSIAEQLPVSYFYNEKYTKDEYVKNIELASLLHDIGKIGVTSTILNKPGPLSNDERKKMEKHTIVGFNTLRRIHRRFPKNTLIDMGIEIARSHHENWDGSGYPDKLSKYDIPLSARIVSIVDVFDALISQRPYKEAFTYEDTVQMMKDLKSRKFDPKLLDYFLTVISKRSTKGKLNI